MHDIANKAALLSVPRFTFFSNDGLFQPHFYFSQEQGQVDSAESLFFDPTSPFFQYILYASLGVLWLCWISGALYEVIYTKQRKRLQR